MRQHSLTEFERNLLDFESQRFRQAGAKATAIQDQFGIGATRYWQLVNRLIDLPEAEAHAPMLVHRLRRLRDSRSRRKVA